MISLRSKITCAILADLFLSRTRSFYANQLAKRLNLDSGNLTRKLHELETDGLLLSEPKGRERYYSLNSAFPLLSEYRQIVLKTVGIEAEIRRTLQGVKGVRRAFLFGSYAENHMDASSDLDLVVIGDHRVLDLQRRIAVVQKKLSNEINVISLSSQEYEKKRQSHYFFKMLENRKRVELI